MHRLHFGNTCKKVKNSKGEPFKGGWAVRPNAVGVNVQVIVSAEMSGKTVQLAPYEFRVKKVPPPIAVFADKSLGSVGKSLAVAQQGVYAKLVDFDFDLTYEVTEFTVLYSAKGSDYEEKSTSYNLTAKQKNVIGQITRGGNLVIKDIKAKQGADGKPIDLQPIILKIE